MGLCNNFALMVDIFLLLYQYFQSEFQLLCLMNISDLSFFLFLFRIFFFHSLVIQCLIIYTALIKLKTYIKLASNGTQTKCMQLFLFCIFLRWYIAILFIPPGLCHRIRNSRPPGSSWQKKHKLSRNYNTCLPRGYIIFILIVSKFR